MVELLKELGIQFEYRRVNSDPAAMREWEQLDGERVPVLRLGKVQQLVGWVGC